MTALSIAVAKTDLGFGQAVALGLLCNALVCLAVWLTYGARTTADKILAIIPPIAAFVAAGFEHSVANMYFISIGLLDQERRALHLRSRPTAGAFGADLAQLLRRQPPPRDHREHHRRWVDGGRGVLVRLPASRAIEARADA